MMFFVGLGLVCLTIIGFGTAFAVGYFDDNRMDL